MRSYIKKRGSAHENGERTHGLIRHCVRFHLDRHAAGATAGVVVAPPFPPCPPRSFPLAVTDDHFGCHHTPAYDSGRPMHRHVDGNETASVTTDRRCHRCRKHHRLTRVCGANRVDDTWGCCRRKSSIHRQDEEAHGVNMRFLPGERRVIELIGPIGYNDAQEAASDDCVWKRTISPTGYFKGKCILIVPSVA